MLCQQHKHSLAHTHTHTLDEQRIKAKTECCLNQIDFDSIFKNRFSWIDYRMCTVQWTLLYFLFVRFVFCCCCNFASSLNVHKLCFARLLFLSKIYNWVWEKKSFFCSLCILHDVDRFSRYRRVCSHVCTGVLSIFRCWFIYLYGIASFAFNQRYRLLRCQFNTFNFWNLKNIKKKSN